MPNRIKSIELTSDEKQSLEDILRCPTTEARKYIRAKILLLKNASYSNEAIADKLDITVPTVRLCLQKYSAAGIENALNDRKGKGRKQEISDDDITWVLHKACQKPTDHGYSADFWYPASFTRFIRSVAAEEGHPSLSMFRSLRSGKYLQMRRSVLLKCLTIAKEESLILIPRCTMYS